MIPVITGELIRILLVLIMITAALIISTRSLSTLIRVYSIQSCMIAVVAVILFLMIEDVTLLLIALITLVVKVFLIPGFIKKIQKTIHIRRDIEFCYLNPAGSIILSLVIMVLLYLVFSRILHEFALQNPLFFLGGISGVSLMLMGLLVTFSRKKAITKVIGYLSMENGVLLFGCFTTELPFIIEFMILIDLVILVLLITILTIGIDSSLEEYHKSLIEHHLWPKQEADE